MLSSSKVGLASLISVVTCSTSDYIMIHAAVFWFIIFTYCFVCLEARCRATVGFFKGISLYVQMSIMFFRNISLFVGCP